MATIVYLDVEDEITTAASRIRTADGTRIGLVLPFGSRVATSRINFRLLAREAQSNGRRLDIVAPDASSRALAASAGLPVFASVGEYEAALESGAIAAAELAGTLQVPVPAAAVPVRKAPGRPTPKRQPPRSEPRPAPVEEAAAEDVPVAREHRRGPRRGLVFAVLLLLVALGAAGVVGMRYLPSAQITVTPRIEAVPPVDLTVTADPNAAAVDVAGRVIPAQALEIPLTSSADFPATGKKVVLTSATGRVQFDSINTVFAVSIPKGTRVSTLDGVVFATTSSVVVPRATVNGSTIHHGFASAGISAVKSGPAANVDAGTITQVPDTLRTQQISVTNAAATTGGARTETPRVAQKDVDAAVAQLRKDLESQFATALLDPARVPAGATLYAETAVLGDPVPAVDPAKLVNKEGASFTLAMSATGTVLVVDPTPAASIGEAAVKAGVTAGDRLVEGSLVVHVSDGTVADGTVQFTVTGTARQVRPLDAADLERRVLGLSETDARRALEAFGTVDIVLWPGWVHAVPSMADRVTVTVAAAAEPAASPSAAPSATRTARPSPTTRPSQAPTPVVSVSPVPSG